MIAEFINSANQSPIEREFVLDRFESWFRSPAGAGLLAIAFVAAIGTVPLAILPPIHNEYLIGSGILYSAASLLGLILIWCEPKHSWADKYHSGAMNDLYLAGLTAKDLIAPFALKSVKIVFARNVFCFAGSYFVAFSGVLYNVRHTTRELSMFLALPILVGNFFPAFIAAEAIYWSSFTKKRSHLLAYAWGLFSFLVAYVCGSALVFAPLLYAADVGRLNEETALPIACWTIFSSFLIFMGIVYLVQKPIRSACALSHGLFQA